MPSQRSASGAKSRASSGKMPVAEQVDPRQRVPASPRAARSRRSARLELHRRPGRGRWPRRQSGRRVELAEVRAPPVDERQPRLAAGIGDVRPAAVEAVVADRVAAIGCISKKSSRKDANVRESRTRAQSRTTAAAAGAPATIRAWARRWVTPVTLDGSRVRLEPLDERHFDDLARVAADDAVFRWITNKPMDDAAPARLVRQTLRECGCRDRGALRDHRPGVRPGDRQHPVHDDRARAPAARDRLDLARDGVPADRREPRGEVPPAAPRLRDARRGAGRVQDPRPERAHRAPRCWASARRSRASCATTRSCPTARTATPRSTASSPRSGRPSRLGSRPPRPLTVVGGGGVPSPADGIDDLRPSLPHGRRAVPDRDRRRARARGTDRAPNAGAGPPRTSTTSGSSSSTSRAATPTCTALRHATRRRLGRPRRRVLPQRGLFDGVWPRDHRARDLGDRDGPDRGRARCPIASP